MSTDFEVGDVILQERPIAGIPYETGLWVVCDLSEARAWISLCGGMVDGKLAGIANWYEISREDLCAFSATPEKALIRGSRDDV